MILQRTQRALILACLILAAGSTADAGYSGTLTSTVTSPSVGVFQYDYTLMVSVNSMFNASELFINFDPGANIYNISNTVGWDNDYTTGDSLVDFVSSDSSLDLTPGQSGTFEFFSTEGPGTTMYDIRSLDPNGVPLNDFAASTVAPVPEPSSAALVAIGGGMVLFLRRRRRRSMS